MTLIRLVLCLLVLNPLWGAVVIIDPGHGGEEDLGAVTVYKDPKTNRYRKVYEKDFALIVAKKIAQELRKYHSVYLTRTIDRAVELEDRAEMADKLGADLFVSVHLNSHGDKTAHGFETYFLSNKRNKAVKKIEAIENKNLKGEDLLVQQILIDLIVERTTKYSKELAEDIHKAVGKKIKRFKIRDRGVRGGLFYVLAMSKRPAVLLELGFMSNPKELRVLMDRKFINAYAKAAAQGIRNYLKKQNLERPPLF